MTNTYSVTGIGITGKRKHDLIKLVVKGKNIEAVEKSLEKHITYSEMYKWKITTQETMV